MSMRRPQAVRKTARPPSYPSERRSHHNHADSDSDEDMLHSVPPARKRPVLVRKNTGHKSARKTASTPSASTSATVKARKTGIGKAALKSPTPEYGTKESSSEVSDTTDSADDSSSSASMDEPSSQDEDELVVKLAHINIKTGSSAPGPLPQAEADKLVDSLFKKALKMGATINEKPPRYGCYLVNFYKSEFDPNTNGPADTTEKPRTARVPGGWRCPMFTAYGDAYKGCALYNRVFPNVGILGLHLSRHHRDLETHWRGVEAGGAPHLHIYPRSNEPEIICETTYYDDTAMGYETLRVVPKVEPTPDPDLSATPETMLADSVPPSTISPPRTTVTLPTPAPPSPIIKRESSPAPVLLDTIEPPTLPPPPAPRPPINRERRTGIPLDPFIQPPYLTEPVPTEDGGFIYYSCRPGGPRLYDYLMVLSLKPYGLMRWQVEETEAHILESEGLSDIGKCMHALHNRWVFLHEVPMYVNPAKCIADFVHTWWYHIYNMVGLKVLTHYLIEFQHLKLITVRQAADICFQYRADVKAGTAEDGSLLTADQIPQPDVVEA